MSTIVASTDETRRAVERVMGAISVDEEVTVRAIPARQMKPAQVPTTASHGQSRTSRLKQRLREIFGVIEAEKSMRRATYITAIIPAHNEERDIARTLESLILQTNNDDENPVDRVVVIVNGSTDKTAAIVELFARAFPDFVSYVVNPTYVTPSGKRIEVKSKVAALNYAWTHFIMNTPQKASEEYVLGLDADVILGPSAVAELRRTLQDDMDDQRIGGVRAVYGFETPVRSTVRTRSLIAGQKLDFAATELSDQLRPGSRVTILGGQATLFRRTALTEVSNKFNKGKGPWNPHSLVEDAYLTRQFEALNYTGVVNRRAKVVVGAMHNAHAWWSQRRKWQNGHIIDIASEKRFALDRTRWGQQFALGFNLALRLLFLALLVTSVAAGTFVFSWPWLIPLGLASLQGTLVAMRMTDRKGWLIIRSATYVLPEIYLWKTLAVWIVSLPKATLAFINTGKKGQSDWLRQARAERSGRTGSWAMWSTIIISAAIPTMVMMAFGFAFPETITSILHTGWMILAVMSVISCIFMMVKILRIIKNYSRLSL